MQNKGVLLLPETAKHRQTRMPTIEIRFSERDTLPELLDRRARELDITVEQLVKRFICTGMQDYESNHGPSKPGESLEDFLVKNGVWKEK